MAISRIDVIKGFMRQGVPLPSGLHVNELATAISHTEMIFTEFYEKTGIKLVDILQANTLSGIVSNLLTTRIADVTNYIPNPDEKKFPDLVWDGTNPHPGIEIKATKNCNKGGEAHNGHGGWYIVACYKTTNLGGILIYQVMAAELNAYDSPDPDWQYCPSSAGKRGSQRTETYTTNAKGTAKLRDGMVMLDHGSRKRELKNLFQQRKRVEREFGLPIPKHSPFYDFGNP